ncbi:MAG TPA: hypothetical protein VLA02_13490 [Reyranella sp.]|nr:hypothetical protein [Reyranella sp.]
MAMERMQTSSFRPAGRALPAHNGSNPARLPVAFLEPERPEDACQRHHDQDRDIEIKQLAIQRPGSILMKLMSPIIPHALAGS